MASLFEVTAGKAIGYVSGSAVTQGTSKRLVSPSMLLLAQLPPTTQVWLVTHTPHLL